MSFNVPCMYNYLSDLKTLVENLPMSEQNQKLSD